MEYKTTDKTISKMAVWEDMTDTEKKCDQARRAFNEFEREFKDYGWDETIVIHGWKASEADEYRFGSYLAERPKLIEWAVARGFLMQVKEKKERNFLFIENPEMAIGEGGIYISIRGEKGNKLSRGSLAKLDMAGVLVLFGNVQKDIGLALDSSGQVKIINTR